MSLRTICPICFVDVRLLREHIEFHRLNDHHAPVCEYLRIKIAQRSSGAHLTPGRCRCYDQGPSTDSRTESESSSTQG